MKMKPSENENAQARNQKLREETIQEIARILRQVNNKKRWKCWGEIYRREQGIDTVRAFAAKCQGDPDWIEGFAKHIERG